MKYHHQLILHDPENGVYGDCMRTAIACLLDKHPSEVPHFLHDNCDRVEFDRRIDEYLATQGFALLSITYTASPQEVIDSVSANNWNTRFLISGRTERHTNHVVIACNGEVEHDPHPSGAGLCAPFKSGQVIVEFLVPRAVHRREKS